ncbi:probable G-protein coupled receptor 21 [Daphnia pulex]|nr:probable G-protein coupled receptor 21 [Daphnia pulex]
MLISLGSVEGWQSSVAESAAAAAASSASSAASQAVTAAVSAVAAVSAAAHQSSIGAAASGGGGSPSGATDVILTAENLTQAVIILILDVVIICSNLLIIATLATGSGGEVMNYYLISLAAADLLAGLLVVPLSIYPALTDSWPLGDVLCSIAGYVEATLWAVSVYSFMWISVDRYLAIRKPLRYETVQTPSRCQCWVIFTWLTSMLACCPPLLQGSTGYASGAPYFDPEAFVCHLNWTGMSAYSVTLVILVLCPTLATVAYTYFYIFSSMRKMRSSLLQQDKEYATALSENLSNPTHLMSFILVMTFWLSWLPFICLTLYEYLAQHRIDSIPFLHFTVFWLGICNSFFKLFIYVAMSPLFRHKLRIFCLSYLCCGAAKRNSANNRRPLTSGSANRNHHHHHHNNEIIYRR